MEIPTTASISGTVAGNPGVPVQHTVTVTTPETHPAPKPPEQPPAPAPAQPGGITLTAAEHRALIESAQKAERLEKAEAEREARRREAEEERLRKNGEYEKLIASRDESIAERDKRLADVERRSKASELDRELALAIAGQPIVEGWSDHLMKLWRDAFEVVADGERWKVKSLDGKTPAEFVKAQLARPEFSPIVRAESATGPANRGVTTGRTDANPDQPPIHPAFLNFQQKQEDLRKAGHGMFGLPGGVAPPSRSG